MCLSHIHIGDISDTVFLKDKYKSSKIFLMSAGNKFFLENVLQTAVSVKYVLDFSLRKAVAYMCHLDAIYAKFQM